MIRKILKYVYTSVYEYTIRCQLSFFQVYLKKYIKKHIKYRTKNTLEYNGLVSYNNNHHEEFQFIKTLLTYHLQIIVDSMCEFLDKIRDVSKNYDGDIFIDCNRDVIIDDITNHIYVTIKPSNYFYETEALLYDIVRYSFAQYDTFDTSMLTAKTKIHEHLVSRLPIFVLCVSILMSLKVTELLVDNNTKYIYIKVSLMCVAYITSIYLVYLRVFQSIRADTKRLASNIYIIHKKKLYRTMLDKYNHSKQFYDEIFKQTI